MSLAEELAQPWGFEPLRPPVTANRRSDGRAAVQGEPTAVLLVGSRGDEHLSMVAKELAARDVATTAWYVDQPLRESRLPIRPEQPVQFAAVLCREHRSGATIAHHNEHVVRYSPQRDGVSERSAPFASSETDRAWLAALDLVDAPVWVNHPYDATRADNKLAQLRVAARHGFTIPRTIVTDDPDEVHAFDREVGGAVYKSLGDSVVWTEEDRAGFLYTSPLLARHIPEMAKLLTHPGLFQQRLWPVAEHRVTVVGSEIFVATIEGCDPPDWRRQLPAAAEFRATTLPPNIVEAAVSTVAELGLQYAAVDLLEAEEAMYFLEVNPSGAWSWLERRLRLPITAAVCDLLCGVT